MGIIDDGIGFSRNGNYYDAFKPLLFDFTLVHVIHLVEDFVDLAQKYLGQIQ